MVQKWEVPAIPHEYSASGETSAHLGGCWSSTSQTDEDEIRRRRPHLETMGTRKVIKTCYKGLSLPGYVCAGCGNVLGIAQRGQRGHLSQAVDTPWQFRPAQPHRQMCWCDSIPHPKPGYGKNLVKDPMTIRLVCAVTSPESCAPRACRRNR